MDTNNFVTKDELDKSLNKLAERLEAAIDGTAIATAKGFENVDNRLDKVENRLDKVENRLNHVENRLGKVESRLDGVETAVKELKTEVIYVKNDVRDLKADTPTTKEFNNHEKRITRLEQAAFPA